MPPSSKLSPKEEIVISDSDPDPVYNWWIEELGLYECDRDALSNGELTDSIINVAQTILSIQFDRIDGFQSTILVHRLKFRPLSPDKHSVQILHTDFILLSCAVCMYKSTFFSLGSHHWLSITCIRSGTVQIMDSLALFRRISLATILQIAKIYSCSVPPTQAFLTLEVLSVQQQEGPFECGLFAIANAVKVCLGTIQSMYDITRVK